MKLCEAISNHLKTVKTGVGYVRLVLMPHSDVDGEDTLANDLRHKNLNIIKLAPSDPSDSLALARIVDDVDSKVSQLCNEIGNSRAYIDKADPACDAEVEDDDRSWHVPPGPKCEQERPLWLDNVFERSYVDASEIHLLNSSIEKNVHGDQQIMGINDSIWEHLGLAGCGDSHHLPCERVRCIDIRSICKSFPTQDEIYDYTVNLVFQDLDPATLDRQAKLSCRMSAALARFYDPVADLLINHRVPAALGTTTSRLKISVSRGRGDVMNAAQIPRHSECAMQHIVSAFMYKIGAADALWPMPGQQTVPASRAVLDAIGADEAFVFICIFKGQMTNLELMISSIGNANKGYHTRDEVCFHASYAGSAELRANSKGKAEAKGSTDSERLEHMWRGIAPPPETSDISRDAGVSFQDVRRLLGSTVLLQVSDSMMMWILLCTSWA